MRGLISRAAVITTTLLLCFCSDTHAVDSGKDSGVFVASDAANITDSALNRDAALLEDASSVRGDEMKIDGAIEVQPQDASEVFDAAVYDSGSAQIDGGFRKQAIADPEALPADHQLVQSLVGNWHRGPFMVRCRSESWRIYKPSFEYTYHLSTAPDCLMDTIDGVFVLREGNLLETTPLVVSLVYSPSASNPTAVTEPETVRQQIYIEQTDQYATLHLGVYLSEDRSTWRHTWYKRKTYASGSVAHEESIKVTLRFGSPLPLADDDECKIEASIRAYIYDDETHNEKFFDGPTFEEICEVSDIDEGQEIRKSSETDHPTTFFEYPEWLADYVYEVNGTVINRERPDFFPGPGYDIWEKVDEVPF